MVSKAIHQQSEKKAPGPDMLNFRVVRLLWKWDKKRIIDIMKHCVRLSIHPNVWKVAKEIVIRKPEKPDYALPKAYWSVCLLNCLGKVIKKVMMELITNAIELKLHTGQFRCR
jgi:pyoverdine/dityrosine biosynthesis protein Dit1